jgi:hypothetical protein
MCQAFLDNSSLENREYFSSLAGAGGQQQHHQANCFINVSVHELSPTIAERFIGQANLDQPWVALTHRAR